ncbi:MAG: CBS domain-containing protein [Nitriliruptor sp.]|uniref:cyclic nucleotide-binding/CBS domain-containing protein n=1 Tax=Nitriliruptor sp. TaxID=2448056 RepID=UPI0034A037CD
MLGIRPTDPVGTLVTGPVAMTSPTATLRAAAETLTSDNLGLLLVVGPAGPRAVLSERDIVASIAAGDDVDVERVRDHATADLLTVDESTSVRDAMRAVLEAEVRHLVIERGGVIVGVVSIRDLAAALLEEHTIA